MKNAFLLLVFPSLMLLFTLAISYIERMYRTRRRRGNLGQKIASAQMHYYYLPTVDGYRIDVLNPERPLEPLPQKPAVDVPEKVEFAHHVR
ncbi:hypothetical protein ACAW74_09605 [Fibrella sp. WM1]|uniref:hypothetical protein n=1 Tax=Fibrella musci TaxID=3242485 RepID=UPI0035208789